MASINRAPGCSPSSSGRRANHARRPMSPSAGNNEPQPRVQAVERQAQRISSPLAGASAVCVGRHVPGLEAGRRRSRSRAWAGLGGADLCVVRLCAPPSLRPFARFYRHALPRGRTDPARSELRCRRPGVRLRRRPVRAPPGRGQARGSAQKLRPNHGAHREMAAIVRDQPAQQGAQRRWEGTDDR